MACVQLTQRKSNVTASLLVVMEMIVVATTNQGAPSFVYLDASKP